MSLYLIQRTRWVSQIWRLQQVVNERIGSRSLKLLLGHKHWPWHTDAYNTIIVEWLNDNVPSNCILWACWNIGSIYCWNPMFLAPQGKAVCYIEPSSWLTWAKIYHATHLCGTSTGKWQHFNHHHDRISDQVNLRVCGILISMTSPWQHNITTWCNIWWENTEMIMFIY